MRIALYFALNAFLHIRTHYLSLLLLNPWPFRGKGAKATEASEEESEQITPTEPEDEEDQEEDEDEEKEEEGEVKAEGGGDETGQAVGGDGAEEDADEHDYPEGPGESGQDRKGEIDVSSEDDQGQDEENHVEAEEGLYEAKEEAKGKVKENNDDGIPSTAELLKQVEDNKLQMTKKDLEHPDNKETLSLDPETVESWWRLDPHGSSVGGTPSRTDDVGVDVAVALDETHADPPAKKEKKKREDKTTEEQTGEGKRAKTVQKKQRDEEKVPGVVDLESDDDEKRGTFQDRDTYT